MTLDSTAKRPKPAPSAFANARTREELATAIQRRLAVGKLRAVELRAIDLVCRLRGWDQPLLRRFIGERFSKAGAAYVVTAIDETGAVSEARELATAPNAPNTTASIAPNAVPDFI
jgi:hypothetical protein